MSSFKGVGEADHPAARAGPALDWLNFFIANLQTGFGPFIAVYLTSHKWTQGQIGVALSVGSAVTLLGQLPGGALVDAMPRKRLAATAGLVLIAGSALLLALWPALLPVYAAEGLHGFASCMLGPAVAAITLGLVGQIGFAERIGRNARYAAIGSAVGAALMGACGTYWSSESVFWLAAGFCLPALIAVRAMPQPRARQPVPTEPVAAGGDAGWLVLLDRRLIAFMLCILLFQLGNAAMLPLAATEVTRRAGDNANLVIAASLMLPQAVVALLSPWVGRGAERFGRRKLLMLGIAALPLRGLLLALVATPALIVGVQLFDGVAGAVIGVLVPLIAADVARGTGRFNLCMGAIGLAVGIGATLSTAVAGEIATRFGGQVAFLALAGAGLAALATVFLALPETRPPPDLDGGTRQNCY